MYGEEKNGQKTPQDNIIKHGKRNTVNDQLALNLTHKSEGKEE